MESRTRKRSKMNADGTKLILLGNAERQDHIATIAFQKEGDAENWYVPGTAEGTEFKLLAEGHIEGFMKGVVSWLEIESPKFKTDDIIVPIEGDTAQEVRVVDLYYNPNLKQYYYECEVPVTKQTITIFENKAKLVKSDTTDQIDLGAEFS